MRPTPVASPELLIWSKSAGELLDLPPPTPEIAELYAQWFSGNQLPPGADPHATRYGGHQFGHWAGQLGDGRAISYGEFKNVRGENWEIQLKGAGPTPYARRADGRAVLRSSLREFLCSEAMHQLGIPTTRALCCVTTGEAVIRDLLYDGNPRPEPGAITTRLAPSFLRFGHFEILAASGEKENLKTLIGYTLRHHFPEIQADPQNPSEDHIATWFKIICERSARLMSEWLRVGFVHGVMNTDNMSILGLTIDYGPYGWLDIFDPDWTPNTTDAQHRRYRYGQQPAIALWNLTRLAEALSTVLRNTEGLEAGLQTYHEAFRENYLTMMRKKLGLPATSPEEEYPFLEELDRVLRITEVDMTLFFRGLADLPETTHDEKSLEDWLRPTLYNSHASAQTLAPLLSWLEHYRLRRTQAEKLSSAEEIKTSMNLTNPAFVLRNYLVQQALEALEGGNGRFLNSLLEALQNPYEVTAANASFLGRRPEWAREKPGCSALSCSS